VVSVRNDSVTWAFNTKRRADPTPPEVERALKWLASNTAPVSRLNDKAVLREVLEAMSLKLDGKQAAAKTVNRKRAVLFNALEYAHELKLLTANRLSEVKWTAPKSVRAIDKRVVINPQQAKSLLSEVEAQRIEGQPRRSSGPMLVAFFAVMYYAALRPEEAAMLGKSDCSSPRRGGASCCCRKPRRSPARLGRTVENAETAGSSSNAEREKSARCPRRR
jgi:integrase